MKLLSGGAAEGLVAALAARFRAEAGAEIEGTFSAVGAIRDRLVAGAPADLVLLSKALIGQLVSSGHVVGPGVDIGIVRTAIAVRTGDPGPAIATPEELRAALLAADALYCPDPVTATAGIHFVGVLEQLGIKGQVEGRLRTFPNGMTAMRTMAAAGDASPIGCTQVTEILATPGVALAGALPKAFELATTYTAAVSAAAAAPEPARALMALLAGPEAAAARRAAGFEAA